MSKSTKGDPKIDNDFIKLLDGITEITKPRKIRNLDRKSIVKGLRVLGHAIVELDAYERVRELQSDGGKKGAARKTRDVKRRRRRTSAKA